MYQDSKNHIGRPRLHCKGVVANYLKNIVINAKGWIEKEIY